MSGTVESNFISGPRLVDNDEDTGTAILDDGVSQTDLTISGNTIQVNDDYMLPEGDGGYSGIAVTVDGATVKGNKTSGPAYAINMNCHAGTVSGNTISFAYNGIANAPAGFLGVNTFYNTNYKTAGIC